MGNLHLTVDDFDTSDACALAICRVQQLSILSAASHCCFRRSHARVSALLAGIAQNRTGATAEAAIWQDASARWLASMRSRFAAYRDVMQPVMLAVFEIKHGLALATLAAAAITADVPSAFQDATAALLSFPTVGTEPDVLASLALSDTAAVALTHAGDVAADADVTDDTPAKPTHAGVSADELRVSLLRAALVACADASSSCAVNIPFLWARTRRLLSRAADLWAQARSDAIEAEAESLSEFRFATRSVAAAAAELAAADEEAAYRARFHLSAFEDLEAQTADGQPADDIIKPPAPAAVVSTETAAEVAASRSLVFSPALLDDVIYAHWAAVSSILKQGQGTSASAGDPLAGVGPLAARAAPHGTTTWAAALRSKQDLLFSDSEVRRCARLDAAVSIGERLLHSFGGIRGDAVHDFAVSGAATLRLCLQHVQLSSGIKLASGAAADPPLFSVGSMSPRRLFFDRTQRAARCVLRLRPMITHSAGLSPSMRTLIRLVPEG